MIKLGSSVKDVITGFTGIVTGRCEYISGCNQLLVTPKVGKDGDHKDGLWIDEQRIKIVTEEIIELDNSQTPGFDMAAPKRN